MLRACILSIIVQLMHMKINMGVVLYKIILYKYVVLLLFGARGQKRYHRDNRLLAVKPLSFLLLSIHIITL